MIQRIQTIYLFCAAAIAFILIFIPIGTLMGTDGYYTYFPFSVKVIHTDAVVATTPFNGLLLIFSSLISFVTIFLFKKRKLQVRFINFNMLVIIGALVSIFFAYPKWAFPQNELLAGTIIDYNYVLLISLFAAVGLFMAKRAILKDEALIKSTERLR
jgi:hypothetical protein